MGSPRTCGQYDLDQCNEWSQPTMCQSYEVCAQGMCELGMTPATLLINEVSYDSDGRDTAQDNTLFIELWGPAGTSLDGWAVVGINGSDGSETNRITLTGEVMGADGYFVIAHPQGDSDLIAAADLTSSDVDFQNGPDSVQLQWRGRVVDAIGYGSFSGSNVFAGEGSAALMAAGGESLTRDAQHTDTDDNAADFSVEPMPSPRDAMIGCVDECAAASDTQCSVQQVQTCGDSDGDGCLEWSAPMACPVAGEVCQGTACAAPCMDECPMQGATQCTGTQVTTCGDYDADTCVEWSAAMACPSGQACVVDQCQSNTAPEVVMITPQGTTQTTQGSTHRILVDPTPTSGRTITKVEFYANNTLIGTTTSSPHEVTYTVPTTTPTGTQIQLQARATDDAGEVGVSAYATLDVQNDVPTASFTATITNTTTVTGDASASTDTETATADLEVCWDWNDDGTCETAWSKNKIATHDYGMSGMYTVRLKVRDPQGQIAEATRPVSFMNIQYIGGTDVTTTSWYGTIVITGDVRVPAGETLTIASGTQVLFVNADVDPPQGVGDYELNIEGELKVEGTAAEPVVFTGQSMAAKTPGGWDRIRITGSTPSTIEHAIIEYADVGLDIRNNSTLTDVTVRKTLSPCAIIRNGNNASLTRVITTECGTDGVHVRGGATGVTIAELTSTKNGRYGFITEENASTTMTNATISDSGNDGVLIKEATLNLSDSLVEDNAGAGLRHIGGADGTATQNQMRNNGDAGVVFRQGGSGSPSPVVQTNNIYSNATMASTSFTEQSPALSTTRGTQTYTAPMGQQIWKARIDYSERASSLVNGYMRAGGRTYTYPADRTEWVYFDEPVSSVEIELTDSSSFAYGIIELTDVGLTKEDAMASYELSASTASGTVTAKFNYWTPMIGSVPAEIFEERAGSVDYSGFTGIEYTQALPRP